MPRHLFRLLLLCQLLLFFLHLWMVYRGAVPETPLFREFQGFVWRMIPRWRIFIGLHALVLSLSAVVVGYLLLGLLRPSGRPLFVLGILSYLAYLRLEPRFQPEEWSFILAVTTAVLGGVLAVFAASGAALSGALRGLLAIMFSFLLFRLARGVGLFDSLPRPWELSTFTLFFGSGYLIGLSYWGEVAADFVVASGQSPEWTRRRVVRGLLVHLFSGVAVLAAVLLATGVSWLWVGVVPFAPLILAFYAPLSWFQATGETVVFSSQLTSNFDMALRNRLLLGILFQYLLLGVAWAIVGALRLPSRRAAIVAHVSLLAYWLPALWLCQMITSYGVP